MKMLFLSYIKMAIWQNDKMTKWQNDKMTKWQNDKMTQQQNFFWQGKQKFVIELNLIYNNNYSTRGLHDKIFYDRNCCYIVVS
jgi:hypothetical protein